MTLSKSTSSLVSLGLGPAVVAAPAGCSSPHPVPTKTTAACSPMSATISWQEKTPIDDAPLGSFVAVVSDDLVTTTSRTSLDPQPSFSQDTINMLADFDDARIRTWKKALLTDLRRTGQVSTTFGAHATLPQENPVTQDSPTPGTFVTDVALNQYRVPFTIDCTGEKPVSGTVSGAESGGTASLTIQCGVPAQYPSYPATVRAEKLCLA